MPFVMQWNVARSADGLASRLCSAVQPPQIWMVVPRDRGDRAADRVAHAAEHNYGHLSVHKKMIPWAVLLAECKNQCI